MKIGWRFWGASFVLGFLFIVLLIVSVGPIPYQGDEWIIPANVENSLGFAAGLKAVADVPKRPLQLAHNALIYYLFDLHDAPMRLASGLLHLLNVAAFAAVVRLALPKGNLAAFVAALLVFIVPAHMGIMLNSSVDGPQLAMMLYWGSVLALQCWILKSPRLSSGLWIELSIVCLVMSFLAYENAILLAPVTLALVWLTGRTHGVTTSPRSTLSLWARVIFVVGASYGFWRAIRWFLNTELLYSYQGFSIADWVNNIVKIVMYIWRTPEQVDTWVIVGGLIGLVASGGLLWLAPGKETETSSKGWWALAGLSALGLLCLGILPYTLAGSVLRDEFPLIAARFYSSSVFGLALLGGIIAALVDSPLMRRALAVVCVVYVAVQAASVFSLRAYHQEIATTYRSLYRDLATLVPDTNPEAVFVIINPYLENSRITVSFFDLNAARTFYGPEALVTVIFDADRATTPEIRERLTRQISAEGYRYGNDDQVVPADHLIILKHEGDHLTLVDRLTPADTTDLLLEWDDGVTELRTNPDMIVHDRDFVKELEARGLLFPTP